MFSSISFLHTKENVVVVQTSFCYKIKSKKNLMQYTGKVIKFFLCFDYHFVESNS